MKRIIILGSTGSIGLNALKVADALPDQLCVAGLAANTDVDTLLEQVIKYGVEYAAMRDEKAAEKLRSLVPSDVTVFCGEEGIEQLAQIDDADMVLCSVVGTAGLRPVMAALSCGRDVALATKEVLVAGGRTVTETAKMNGARIIPVDSEHNALHQCLGTEPLETIKKLILTASGGPFFADPELDLSLVTVEQALDHPNWSMGRKVTIDSATMMNKGLEIIEARWLFDIPVDSIEVVIHPESIVHSMVEYIDGSTLAQLSVPDMRYAIQNALTYPDRFDGGLAGLDFSKMSSLNFVPADMDRFPALRLAREAGEREGTLPCVMNAANETAVELFLAGTISFSSIWETVERVMGEHDVIDNPDLSQILTSDAWARSAAGLERNI